MPSTNKLEIEIGIKDQQARRDTKAFASDFNSQMTQMAQGGVRSATGALDGLLGKLGSAKVILGAAAAGVGALAMQWLDLAKAEASAAEQIVNMAERTGMTIGQVDRLQAMAQIANVNLSGLNTAARALSNGLEDTSANGTKAWRALQELGVSTVDVAGKQRDLGQVTLDVVERLGGVESAAKRTALANAALGRGAVELMPLIKNYQELDRTVREMGFGTRDGLIKSLAEADDKMDALGLRWQMLKGKLAQPITAVVDIVTRIAQGPSTMQSGGAVMWTPDFLTDALAGKRLGSNISGVGDPASAILAGDRASAARSIINADPRRRLAALGVELSEAQRRALAGEAGALGQYLNLSKEKASLEKLLRDMEDLKRQRERVIEASAKVSERYGDLVAGGLSKMRGSASGGEYFGDMSLAYLLDRNYQDTRVRPSPFDPIAFQGSVANYAIDQYGELARAEKERNDAALRSIREQQDAYESMFNRLRSGFETTFDAFVRNGMKASQLVRSLLLTALLTPIKQAASNWYANLFMPMMGGRAGYSAPGGTMGSMGGFGSLASLGTSSLGMAGMIGPGGTAPFVAGGGGFGNFSGMGAGLLGSLSQLGGIGMGGSGLPSSVAMLNPFYKAPAGVSGVAGGAMLAGGGTLAALGLQRGGWSGMGMTAAGGALIGFKFGGPMGALIGGAIGAGVGLFRMLFGGAEKKAREKIKSYYGVDVADKGFLKQIIAMAKQTYGGNLDVAIRSRDVRDMIELYAMSTGQRMSALDNVARGVSLSQSGGSIYQTGSYSNGVGYSYGGAIQAAAGLSAFAAASKAAPIVLDKEGTKEFWSDVMATGIVENPRAVQKASNAATRQNYGRTGAAINLTDPLGVTI